MSRKGTKIKRYGSIYGRNSGSLAIVMVMVVGLAIFGVAGWLLYTPIHDFIMSVGEEKPAASESVPTQPKKEEPTAPDKQQQTVVATKSENMNAVYLPVSVIEDREAFSASLEKAAAAGFNSVVIDAKDASGSVLYLSNNDVAKSSGVAAPNAYDAAAAAKAIKEKGLSPVVRLHAFRDALAPIAAREMAVHYYDTEVYWFDNAPELGGKPWLNPYSEKAQNYILSLIEELCAAGFETVLLDSVQFPSGVGLDKAGYGVNAANTPKLQRLITFTDKAKNQALAKGAELILCSDGEWLAPGAEADNQKIYGETPAKLFDDGVMLELSADSSSWDNRISQMKNSIGGDVWVVVPAYAEDGTLVESDTLVKNITAAKVENYLLFNPQGNYKYN